MTENENDFYATCQIGDAPWPGLSDHFGECRAHSVTSLYRTRSAGHPGRHVAETTSEVVTFWGGK